MLVRERLEQAGPVAEAAEDRPLPDARFTGDRIDRRSLGSALGQDPGRGLEDAHAVGCRISALAARPRDRQPPGVVYIHGARAAIVPRGSYGRGRHEPR